MLKTDARQFVLNEMLLVKAIPIAEGRIAVLCHDQAAAAERIYLTQVLTVSRSGEWKDIGRFKWHGVDLAVGDNGTILVVGRNGEVGSVDFNGGVAETSLEKGRAIGPMRGIIFARGAFIAFGMNRHVYRLLPNATNAKWERFESGFSTDDHSEVDFERLLDDLGGINCMSVKTNGELVAAGMNGEVWRALPESTVWSRQESGTNVALNSMLIDQSGVEVACGLAGTVILNKGAGWESVSYQGTQDLDFTSIASGMASWFLADGHSLRSLKGDVLEVVDMKTPQMVPCARLSSGFGLVVGCATKELFYSDDSHNWNLLL